MKRMPLKLIAIVAIAALFGDLASGGLPGLSSGVHRSFVYARNKSAPSELRIQAATQLNETYRVRLQKELIDDISTGDEITVIEAIFVLNSIGDRQAIATLEKVQERFDVTGQTRAAAYIAVESIEARSQLKP